jgi:cytochrome c553
MRPTPLVSTAQEAAITPLGKLILAPPMKLSVNTKIWIAAGSLIITSLCANNATAGSATSRAAAALMESSCRTCHGVSGNSPSELVPRLNGQRVKYLRNRLASFSYPIRESPNMIHRMGHLSALLTRDVANVLAEFYAAQIASSPGSSANPQGAAIYRDGARDIPACRRCHGERGEGRGAVPRLVGQHKAYLRLQLQAFSSAGRIADPMTHHVWVMTPQQSEAIADYLGN